MLTIPPLQDGETAHLTLVSFSGNRFERDRLVMHDDEHGGVIGIPGRGVVVEVSFKAVPPLKAGTVSKCLKITCTDAIREILNVKEISCD
jgi:hypothetical protein